MVRDLTGKRDDLINIQGMADRAMSGQVEGRQIKELPGRTQASAMDAVNLMEEMQPQMHEASSQLNEPLEESVVRIITRRAQPQVFQHIMCFIVLLPVKAVQIADETGMIPYGHAFGGRPVAARDPVFQSFALHLSSPRYRNRESTGDDLSGPSPGLFPCAAGHCR